LLWPYFRLGISVVKLPCVLLLSELQRTSCCLAGRTPESWNIGKMFGGIWKIT
jgi:hypothetical protein